VATFSQGKATTLPGTPGVPEEIAALTVVVPFNDLEAVARAFEANPGAIAAVMLEPVAGNMGLVAPKPGYLQGLRDLCTANGALLVFDEVMTGFRVARGGAQERYGVRPDLTCMGKVVGGGYPLAAFGGRADLMDLLAPVGPVYQGGTLSGNPVAVAAGLATLELLDDRAYARLEEIGARIEGGLREAVAYHGCSLARVGSMFTVFFRPEAPTTFSEVQECDLEAFGRFFRASLDGGVYLPASQYEAAFLPAILADEEVDRVVDGLSAALVAANAY
jgi:glutamate-1-semialdehyde 2,1-aminomutase